ncbi:MAG: hypothetical protein KDA20_04250 [Phycisphaerales bacterium]|nr:hypothetical protein [Phycisphaerales bacterium]
MVNRPAQRTHLNVEPVALPGEPIAAPATNAATLSSHIRVALQPIGEIAFDGQTLPVLSPDGKFIATQVGPTPSWATILGEEGAPLASTHIERYELTETGPRSLGDLDVPVGTLLSRHANPNGFIVRLRAADVEQRRAASWLSGAMQELPGDAGVDNAGVFSPDHGARVELTEDGRLELVMTEADRGAQRRMIASDATPFISYQVLAPLQDPISLPLSDTSEQQWPPGFLFFHPGAERMAIYVFATTDIVLLEKNSIAGAWFVDGDRWGVFLTTPEGLQFQALGVDSRGVIVVGSAARVLNEAWVPRSTSDPEHPYVLIGPGKSRDMLQLMWMMPVSE